MVRDILHIVARLIEIVVEKPTCFAKICEFFDMENQYILHF